VQDSSLIKPIAAAAIGGFLKTHQGPVLDVRMSGDCDESRSLIRTTHRLGFDLGPEDPVGKKMAQDMFMSQVRENKILFAAKRTNTTVLVVCCAGGRSEAAALLMATNGFKVVHVPGGMQSENIPTGLLKQKQ
jgi:rhodanese-related sulfurtransferase